MRVGVGLGTGALGVSNFALGFQYGHRGERAEWGAKVHVLRELLGVCSKDLFPSFKKHLQTVQPVQFVRICLKDVNTYIRGKKFSQRRS